MTLEKLVRDRVPEIMRASGISVHVRTVTSHEELLSFLMAKLLEETAEFHATPNVDELADIFEVLDALMGTLGVERAAVDARKRAKAAERGAFVDGLVLRLEGGDGR
ncbi:phosphoribosyl-ATP pyrophosphohydrolase [Microbacterium sp. 22215]|uniref:phosphoribosyl-ATP pyrophosphohydrolase n=1 Tax=Microbacterium sp. 22215 TaxID=3453893 RepID=UPI003F830A73